MKRSIQIVAATALVGVALSMVPVGATTTGPSQGCTPGYWKNHTASWQEYTATTKVGTVWTFPTALASFKNETFLVALQGGGGTDLNGATTILLRAAVASYLNASNDSVGYPLRRSLP